MQRYGPEDPYEREPLDADRSYHHTPPPRRPMPASNPYEQPASPYHDSSPPLPSQYQQEPAPYGRQDYSHSQHHYGQQHHQDYRPSPQDSPYESSSRGPYGPPAAAAGAVSAGYAGQEYAAHDYSDHGAAPAPPRHGDNSYYSGGGVAPSMPHEQSYGGQLPPPPSRTAYPNDPYAGGPTSGGHAYDPHGYGQGTTGRDSYSNLAAIGASRSGSRSPSHFGSEYDNPFSTPRGYGHGPQLGEVNPNDIADDGDDGLVYGRPSNRNSMLSSHNSDRTPRGAGMGAAAAAGGAGVAAGGLMKRSGPRDSTYDLGPEKPSDWMAKKQASRKKWKWVIIAIAAFVIIGAIVGGVVGGVVMGDSSGSGSGGGGRKGQSAEEDEEENGDLGKNSAEIKKLLNNPDLHKVFPGMDYTPLNTQYPYCIHDPPSQNNITRDVAVLSQLTNKIRLYGTDCNQTQMLIHAIDRLDLQDDVKVWLGVWQDDNSTTNARQLEQMWDILDEYGAEPFEGIIVANEILFRKEMTITQLATILDEVRTNLSNKNIDLPVATSDLGDDWTTELANDSDYLMANIHPFFAGVDAKEAASWTYSFWQNQNSQFFKSDKTKNIIAEVGWPTGGGTNCGGATSCTGGSVAGVDGTNQLLEDWVCPALKNGTEYFWFSAFDEPWKERFNEKGKEWEDKWGLMDVNRNLKNGLKIPDCGSDNL
ncbi:glycoside hydrolase [Sarocladium strictum]